MDRSLAEALAERIEGATARADAAATRVSRREWGRVEHVGDGVANISGLPGARHELDYMIYKTRTFIGHLESITEMLAGYLAYDAAFRAQGSRRDRPQEVSIE